MFYDDFEPDQNQNQLELCTLCSKTKYGNAKFSMVKRSRGEGGGVGQRAATTVLQATGGLSYLETTPDRVAGISCC